MLKVHTKVPTRRKLYYI